MPIRFRCAYCNQLLGIARRKAGTVVRCPNCAGQVVVPNTEEEPEPEAPEKTAGEPERAPAKPSGGVEQPLFERSDFAEVLKPAQQTAGITSGPAASAAAPPRTVDSKNEPAINVERVPLQPALIPTLEPMAPSAGIWLSPAKATLLAVLAVLMLTLAFVIGLMVGLYFGRAPL